LVDSASLVLPTGLYYAALFEITPELVRPGDDRDYFSREQVEAFGIDPFWGLPHDPRTEYYRGVTMPFGEGSAFYEFVVPMYPSVSLDKNVCDEFSVRLLSGERPTAFGVGLLDVKQPAVWEGEPPPVTEHWCLAHFLLDGHHKTFAAAQAGLPLTVLSFIAVDQGVASREKINQALLELGGDAARV